MYTTTVNSWLHKIEWREDATRNDHLDQHGHNYDHPSTIKRIFLTLMIVIFIISLSAFMIISTTMTRTRSVPPPCEVLHLLPWDTREELLFLRAPPLRWVRVVMMVMVMVLKEVDDDQM